MRKRDWLLGLALLGVGLPGMAAGGEPDPEAVRRLMEKYERDAEAEASKPATAPTVDYDHEAWKSAERCGTAGCFEAYLEEYPQGRYARMVRARLKPEPTLTPVVAVPLEKSSRKSSDLNVVPIPQGCFRSDSKKGSGSDSKNDWSWVDDRACEF